MDQQTYHLLERLVLAQESQSESLATIAEAVSLPRRIVLGANQNEREVNP